MNVKERSEVKFLKGMISDSDLNGAKYFLRILRLIKKSGLPEGIKSDLVGELEEVSGYCE